MDNNGILQLKGFFADFFVWDDTIHSFACKFYEKYNVYPNILLASDFTYRKIDLYAQKHPERLIDPDGEETIETSNYPYEGLSYFSTDDYDLELCLDYKLTEGNFILIFDETPDFSGEPNPVPEENEEITNIYFYKKSA